MDREITLYYEKLRLSAQKDFEKRVQKLYIVHPELKKYQDELSFLYIQKTRCKIANDDKAVIEKEKRIAELKTAIKEYIAGNNLKDDDFKIKYACDKCHDTGYRMQDGKFILCECVKKITMRQIYAKSNLMNKKADFDTFNLKIFDNYKKYQMPDKTMVTQREIMEKYLSDAKTFVKNVNDEQYKSMIFYGKTGLGKSFLSSAIAKEVMKTGFISVYYSIHELIYVMENVTFIQENRQDFKEEYERLFTSDLLIIDDLGTEVTNSFIKSFLFDIINRRTENSKKMIISTNLSIIKLKEIYEERIFSRLSMYFKILPFIGEDIRFKSKK